MEFFNYIKKNKTFIILLSILVFAIFSVYSNSFGMEEMESLDFTVGQVTANKLNIRRGPGITYENVGILSKDNYIRVFAKIGNWYVVQTENNIIGAVSSDYVKPCYDKELEIQPTNAEAVEETASQAILSEEESAFLNSINNLRAENNLPALQIDDNTQNVARLKAQDLVENNYFSHTSEKYGTPFEMLTANGVTYKTASENIAGNSTLEGAVNSWMNSESHKNNILNNSFNYTGVAIVNSPQYRQNFSANVYRKIKQKPLHNNEVVLYFEFLIYYFNSSISSLVSPEASTIFDISIPKSKSFFAISLFVFSVPSLIPSFLSCFFTDCSFLQASIRYSASIFSSSLDDMSSSTLYASSRYSLSSISFSSTSFGLFMYFNQATNFLLSISSAFSSFFLNLGNSII